MKFTKGPAKPVTITIGSDVYEEVKSGSLIAKKAFKICHNDYEREIGVGEDLSDIPEIYLENLKTEGVL